MGDVHHCSGPLLRNDLYCVEWDVKLYYNILLILTVLVIILHLETYSLFVGFVAVIVFIENLYFTIKMVATYNQ